MQYCEICQKIYHHAGVRKGNWLFLLGAYSIHLCTKHQNEWQTYYMKNHQDHNKKLFPLLEKRRCGEVLNLYEIDKYLELEKESYRIVQDWVESFQSVSYDKENLNVFNH